MKSRQKEMLEQFEAYDKAHPEIWQMFVKFAHEKIAQGFKHYGAKSIIERARWETDVNPGRGDALKIGNNHTAFYSRKFEQHFPEHKGFFRKRKQKSEEMAATWQPEPRPSQLDRVMGFDQKTMFDWLNVGRY